jgi:arylsulfatase A-like enzyme
MYDGDLRNSDRHVGQLLALIEELGLREKVAVVVTSDHGEELNDHYPHNTGGHGHSLRDPLLKVPLIVRDPTRRFAVKRASQVVRLIDVMPTVLDMLDVSQEVPLDGRTLLPVLRGEETRDRVAVAGQTNIGPFRVAVRAMGFKYIVTLPNGGAGSQLSPVPPFRQLYDLKRDPHERDNLARKTRLVATFDELLRRHHPLLGQAVDPGVSEDTDPRLLERLRSLGYVR